MQPWWAEDTFKNIKKKSDFKLLKINLREREKNRRQTEEEKIAFQTQILISVFPEHYCQTTSAIKYFIYLLFYKFRAWIP